MSSPLPITFCFSEDRPEVEVGVRLLVASLRRHCPGTRSVFYNAKASDSLRHWLRKYPDVQLVQDRLEGADAWNCKPHAMLPLLRAGHPQVVWLDTDVLLEGDPRPIFANLAPEVFGVAQEPACVTNQGTDGRINAWGEPIGRSFPFTLNSCVLRATQHHIPLLERWETWLADERYRKWYRVPEPQPPFYALSDQDVLNVVLACRDFAHVPVRVLKSGMDIIHSGGALVYSPKERLRGLLSPHPPILHALAVKPWVLLDPKFDVSTRYWFFRQLLQEISPFVAAARKYREEIEVPCPWLDFRSTPGRFVRLMGMGHWALRGLPVGLAVQAISNWRPKAGAEPQ